MSSPKYCILLHCAEILIALAEWLLVLFINITSISTRNGICTTNQRKFTRWTSREKGTAERRSLKMPDCFSLQGWNDSLHRQRCKNSCQLGDPILHSTLKLKWYRRCSCSGKVSTENCTITHLLWNFQKWSVWVRLCSDRCVPVTSGFHRFVVGSESS